MPIYVSWRRTRMDRWAHTNSLKKCLSDDNTSTVLTKMLNRSRPSCYVTCLVNDSLVAFANIFFLVSKDTTSSLDLSKCVHLYFWGMKMALSVITLWEMAVSPPAPIWFKFDALARDGKVIVDCSSLAFVFAIGLARGLTVVGSFWINSPVVGEAEVFPTKAVLVFSFLLLDLIGDGVKIASPGLVTVGSTWIAGLKPIPSTP